MTGSRHPSGINGSALALLLVACAIMLRTLIPAGFMIAPAAQNGGWSVVLCSGNGPVTVILDADGRIRGDAPAPAAPTKHDAPCAFAGLLAPVLPVVDTVTPLPLLAPALHDARENPGPRVGQGLAAPPPPVRGPPVSRL